MIFSVNRRAFGLGAGALAIAATTDARAQAFPNRPIRVIVPLSAASTGDIVARKVGESLSAELGQPLIIDNQPGAGGVTATAQIARSAKDGYTLGVVSSNHVVSPSVIPNVGYDAVKDFTWLSILTDNSFVLAVPAASPAKTVKDLIDMAKAKPNDVTYASSGNGTVLHLAGVLFAREAGVSLKHVPYKGLAPAINDLLGGVTDSLFTAYAPIAGHVQAGKLRVLAVSTKTRDPVLPNVPTLIEFGLPNYEYTGWIAMMGPADLPKDVVERMTSALRKVVSSPEIREAFGKVGTIAVGNAPADAAKIVAADFAKQTELVKLAGAKVE